MATLDLTAAETNVLNTHTYVSQDDADHKVAFLPQIDDGAGSTVAVDTEIRFEALAGGSIEIRDSEGKRVGIVLGRSEGLVVAKEGVQESAPQRWAFRPQPQTPSAFQSIGASFVQAEVVALRDCLVNHGFMKAE